ncbi:peptidoglycan editing factor PgeF [Serratia marcescens]|uniref:peptidoglycan editing factor PgeF n=1 Tax=Serratia marcescens TaxID=615 RepID=UPI0023A9E662|nr:peptidoglycan editing factor PgeF [Serratia marcescens]WEA47664.1 peptidoglycan editing factor PgeF [Serratia marcescens]
MSDRSALLDAVPHIQHGFGSKLALLPGHLLPYSATLPEKKQVHGTRIVDVLQPAQACGEADGFYTRQPGILLSVLTADCLPVLFSRRDGGAIAAVHAGWRGLLDGILEQMAARIRQDGDTADWVVSIGPAAGPCCYEVDEALVESFKQRLPLPATLISPHYRHLDLAAIAEYKLAALGFAAVDRAGSCTICTPGVDPQRPQRFKYTSYRRNSHRRAQDPTHPGIKGRNQYAGIIIAAG